MNKVVLLLLLSLVGWISCDTPAEQAAERFFSSLKKHLKLCDQDIFDPDFHIAFPDIRISYRKSVEAFCQTSNIPSDNTKRSSSVTCSFTNDGFLKISGYTNDKQPYYVLAKPNKSIEGGYKFLRMVYESGL